MAETDPPHAVAERAARRMEAGWNAADGGAFAAPFAATALFVDVSGGRQHGRALIARSHQALLDGSLKGSRLSMAVTDARSVGAGIVVARVEATVDAPSGPSAGRHESTVTVVLGRMGAGWEVVSAHNTATATASGR